MNTSIDRTLVTTAFEIDGRKIVKNLGITRGIIVRSRSLVGNIGAGIQTLFGGNITILTSLCEKARQDAFDLMLTHAAEMGANAVIGFRYDTTDIAGGVSEVLAYGTAVVVE
ncbi:MAG TPA: YbjQ family protein [Candidatus Paceibacterota bacterium]|nr:YbjQ family protein [Candidatus Paceibacterota bacterium]